MDGNRDCKLACISVSRTCGMGMACLAGRAWPEDAVRRDLSGSDRHALGGGYRPGLLAYVDRDRNSAPRHPGGRNVLALPGFVVYRSCRHALPDERESARGFVA